MELRLLHASGVFVSSGAVPGSGTATPARTRETGLGTLSCSAMGVTAVASAVEDFNFFFLCSFFLMHFVKFGRGNSSLLKEQNKPEKLSGERIIKHSLIANEMSYLYMFAEQQQLFKRRDLHFKKNERVTPSFRCFLTPYYS